jgi:hypothetical protein
MEDTPEPESLTDLRPTKNQSFRVIQFVYTINPKRNDNVPA